MYDMTDPISPWDDTGNPFIDIVNQLCGVLTMDHWWPFPAEPQAGD